MMYLSSRNYLGPSRLVQEIRVRCFIGWFYDPDKASLHSGCFHSYAGKCTTPNSRCCGDVLLILTCNEKIFTKKLFVFFGIGSSNHIGEEIQCVPYAGFFLSSSVLVNLNYSQSQVPCTVQGFRLRVHCKAWRTVRSILSVQPLWWSVRSTFTVYRVQSKITMLIVQCTVYSVMSTA